MVDLSIVIVSWNVRDLLQRCLHSVLGAGHPKTEGDAECTAPCILHPASCTLHPAPSIEILVVDNGSTDGSVEMLRADFDDIHVVVNAENRGFPAGNNQGMALSGGRYVLLLNPDTEVIGDALATMVSFADEHPDVGVIGPQLLNPDGSVQSSRRRFPTLATAFFESTWLQPYAPRSLLERYYVLDQPDDAVLDVDWVQGAALMARREAIDQIGPMDERFFMYSEELEWCRRFREAGWRVVYLPGAQVVHHAGKSSEQVLPARHVHFQTSKVRYFYKYHGRIAAGLLRLFLLGNYAWQLGIEGLKWLIGHRRHLREGRITAYWQVLRSGLR